MAKLDIIIRLIKKGRVAEMAIQVPTYTEADEGKVLGIVGGELAWVMPTASGGNDCHITYIESTDTSNMKVLRELESGTYVLYGKFLPYAGASSTITFSSDLLVNVITKTAGTHVQVFYPVNNCIQFLSITDDAYERKNVYVNDLLDAVGTLSDLDTADKTSLVAAINELAANSTSDNILLTDKNTGKNYELTIVDGALTMSEVTE